MPTDIIEMFWGCTTCSSENKGRFKTCQNCGKPRTEGCQEWMPGDTSPMAAVKDAKLLRKFTAGADWTCLFCQSSQFRDDGTCAQCGATQEINPMLSGAVVGRSTRRNHVVAETAVKVSKHVYPRGTGPNGLRFPKDVLDVLPLPADDDQPFVTEGSYREAPQRAAKPARTPPPVVSDVLPSIPMRRFPMPSPRLLGAIAGAFIIAIALYFIFRTRVVDTRVTAVAWTYTVKVDRYQVWRREGWNTDPTAFNVHDEGSRVHHYDHVRIGSHQESYQEQYACGETCRTIKGSCYTTSRNCTSNRNGSATCTGGDRECSPDTQSCSTKYCNRTAYRTIDDYEDQPRYRDWYSWNVWDWGFNRDVVTSGSSTETHWPLEGQTQLNVGLKIGEQERESARLEVYQVTMAGDGDTFQYTPKSATEFQRFSTGSPHRIKVGVAHGVEVLQ